MLIMVLLAFHYYLFISLETASDPPNESFDSSQLIVLVFIVLHGVKLYLYLVRVRLSVHFLLRKHYGHAVC